jgi:hypothetical protein
MNEVITASIIERIDEIKFNMGISNMKTNGDPRRHITEQITMRSKMDLLIKEQPACHHQAHHHLCED